MNAPHSPALEALRARAPRARPQIAVVLGSGWGALTERIADPVRIAYADLPVSRTPASPAIRVSSGSAASAGTRSRS
jgi:purine nucleoside phosphorylase